MFLLRAACLCLALGSCASQGPRKAAREASLPPASSPTSAPPPASTAIESQAAEAPASTAPAATSPAKPALSTKSQAQATPAAAQPMTQPDTAEHGTAETPDLAKSVFALRVRSAAGGLDVQAVQGILGLASQAFGDCDELVARDARASIHFRVSRRGVATRTRSTGASEAARRCFARALSRVVFPEAKRPTNVVLELSRRRRVPTIIHHPPVARSTQQVRALYARGQRSSLSLERILRMYRPRFAPCYEQILHSRPGFTADVPVRFAVKPDGSIHNLVIQSNHYALRSCMATFMRTLRFSPMPHQADTTVSFILEFRPPPKRINGKHP